MNAKTYEDLSKQLKDPLKNSHLIYSVYDVDSTNLYQLNNFDIPEDEPVKYFTIVLDEHHKDSPLNHPSTYYCTSIQELKQIILYTIEHEDLYFTTDDYLTDDPDFNFESVE